MWQRRHAGVCIGLLLGLVFGWGAIAGSAPEFEERTVDGISVAVEETHRRTPQPELTSPEPGEVAHGIIVLAAKQNNRRLNPSNIKSARFEYSPDGTTWTLIGEETDLFADELLEDPRSWDIRWDPRSLAPGDYSLRVIMTSNRGRVGESTPVHITLNRPPVPQAAAKLVMGTTVEFDGSGSQDEDGQVVDWRWDFNDGTTAFGSTVMHDFADLESVHEVSLIVTDDDSAQTTTTYEITLYPVTFQQRQTCRCKDITLRGDNFPAEENALGKDGAPGGDNWPAANGFDGAKLGPLDGNPANRGTGFRGQKQFTGYSFEIVADIEGTPAECKQIQLARWTHVATGFTRRNCEERGGTFQPPEQCTLSKTWEGTTADLDKNGTDDIDVATQAKCVAAGGTWNGGTSTCTLKFPENGPKYGPDVEKQSEEGGAYESPFTYKVNLANKIIWVDSPAFSLGAGAAGTTKKYQFVSLVRGTDGKYCFIKSTLNLERKPGAEADVEQLTQTDKQVNVDRVPGVP